MARRGVCVEEPDGIGEEGSYAGHFGCVSGGCVLVVSVVKMV